MSSTMVSRLPRVVGVMPKYWSLQSSLTHFCLPSSSSFSSSSFLFCNSTFRLLWRGGSCIRKKGQQQHPFLKHPCFMTIAAFDNNQFQAAAGNVSVYSSKDVRLEKKMKQQQEGNRVEEFLSTSTTTKAEAVDDDTIAAIVTAMGGGSHQGAVAIVRLSGPSAVQIAARHFFPSKQLRNHHNPQDLNVLLPWRPKSHRVEHGLLRDASGTLIDEVLVVPMLAPRSYTREDVVEVQCHGGDVCVRRVLQLCLEAGARLAQPGEFTLRAFLNGRLDLAQAESVAQVVAAKTSAAAETALAGIQGGLSSFVQSLRMECIDLLVEMEARLDFDDEMPILDTNALIGRVETMSQRLQQALATAGRGHLLQSGLQVAIVGRPNVGKSSLLNAWSQSERAIVTDIPGTTRDIVEARMEVGGIMVNLLDTAGICNTLDIVEKIGIERSKAVAKGADVVVMVISASDGWTPDDSTIFQQFWGTDSSSSQAQPSTSGVLAGPMAAPTNHVSVTTEARKVVEVPSILVVNKVDRAAASSVVLPEVVERVFFKKVAACAIQQVGMQELDIAILDLVGLGHVTSHGHQWAVNQRQAEQLMRANEALQRMKDSVHQQLPMDMWTIDLKEAALALGQISGDDVSEEVLSNIFSRFCIGK